VRLSGVKHVTRCFCIFLFAGRKRHTTSTRDWSSDVCSSDLPIKSFFDAAMAVAEDLEVAAFLRAQPKKLFIGGRWVESASGKTFETLDPATGQVLTRVAEAGAEDVDRAVAAARRSFDRGTWRDLPRAER